MNPNIGSEWQEICESDPNFEEYYWGGMYDITCSCCKGKGVILVIDESLFTNDDNEAFAKYQLQQEKDRYYEAEYKSERRMGY